MGGWNVSIHISRPGKRLNFILSPEPAHLYPCCIRIDLYVELETLIYLRGYLSTIDMSRNIKWNREAVSAVKGKCTALSEPSSPSCCSLCQKGIAMSMRIASCLEVLGVQLRLTKMSHSLLPNPVPTISSLCFWILLPNEQKTFRERNWPLAAKCLVPQAGGRW